MINIDKVSKSYGKDQVLDEVGLSIDKGKFTAFMVKWCWKIYTFVLDQSSLA